jgi:hypothetical protein
VKHAAKAKGKRDDAQKDSVLKNCLAAFHVDPYMAEGTKMKPYFKKMTEVMFVILFYFI